MTPFDSPQGEVEVLPPDQSGHGSENALQRAHEAGAMDIQVATAQRLGRNLAQFKADLERFACSDPEIAEECQYALKKGGTPIVGPSIRFAELIQATYRHIVVDVFVEEEARSYVVAGAMARDLYANTGVRQRVRRSILNKKGARYGPDMVNTTIQAAQSLAMRNVVMRLVPKALWLPIWRKARQVALGNAQPHAERVQTAFTSLSKFHITEEEVLAHLEVPSRENLNADHMIQIRNKFRAIQAGELDPAQAFPAPQADAGQDDRDSAKEAVDRITQAQRPQQEPAQEPAQEDAPASDTPEAEPQQEAPESEDGAVDVEL